MTALIRLDRTGPIAVLTLNRPERHNSLVPELLGDLLAALASLATDPDVRAAVLQADGPSFSSGGDLAGFRAHLAAPETYAGELVGLLNQAILALVDLPVPVVAAVHGLVTGGSLGLVLGCDLVLVAPEATFTPYYGAAGFSPDGGWTAMLPAVIGPKRTAEVLLCNRTVTAEQAVAWGLASRLVPAHLIRDEALRIAHEIATLKPGSIAHTRRLLSRFGPDLPERLEAERLHFVDQVGSEEARQGVVALLERLGR